VQVLDEKNVVTCEVIEGNDMSSVKFLRVLGYGPAWHMILAVLDGPAQHENRPRAVPRPKARHEARIGTAHEAQQPVTARPPPGRAGLLSIYTHHHLCRFHSYEAHKGTTNEG
jgi:hypothetical protein